MFYWLQLPCFSVDDDDAAFVRRGFRCGKPPVQKQLEQVGRTFLSGYRAALAQDAMVDLVKVLDVHELELRGFAYEGAAMGLAILDVMTPGRRDRLRNFLAGPSLSHVYMAHVGAGWALARLPFGWGRILEQLDPLLISLAFDGYGFHKGYFSGPQGFSKQVASRWIKGYARRAFDQGLGRALWFVEGADVAGVSDTVSGFSIARQADLWSGIGLVAAYAGGMDNLELGSLQSRAGQFRPHLAQGAAFAAKARSRAGNLVGHTERACRVLIGRSAKEAAEITDAALTAITRQVGGPEPYESWRARIRAILQSPGESDEQDRALAEARRS
jgi:hypothetical protein